MPLTNVDLYNRLETFKVDDGSAPKSFLKRLQKSHGWSADFAEQAMREYLRFIYLATVSTAGVSPSKAIDEVWHLHLTFTRSYWSDLCKDILDKDIHHEPGSGLPGESFRDVFAETLALYATEFDEPAPAEVWNPQPKTSAVAPIRRKTSRFWLIAAPIATALTMVAILGATPPPGPGAFAPIFFGFLFCAVVPIVIVIALVRASIRRGYRTDLAPGNYVETGPVIFVDTSCSTVIVQDVVSCSSDSAPVDNSSSCNSSSSCSSSSCSSSSCSSSSD